MLEQRARGEFIFHVGDPANAVYILIQGTVKKTFVNPGGDEKTISIYLPGDLFGHLFLGKYRHRIASAQALDDVTVARLPESGLTQLIGQHPRVGMALISHLADEQRQTLARLHALMHLDVRHRLLGVLLSLGRHCCADAQKEWFDVPTAITQTDLAHLACMNRSTVNVMINSLRSQRILGGEGRTIKVNRAAVERLLLDAGMEILE
jgi:CRP-like cAMP-binding protein